LRISEIPLHVKNKRADLQYWEKGINPFTTEETMFRAKPAFKDVKIKPLKKIKDMAG